MSVNIRRAAWTVALALGGLVGTVPAAVAQEAARGVYDGPGGTATQVATGAGGGSGGSVTDPTAGGALPFTGLDIVMALGGGVVLILAGLALARVLQPGPEAGA